jgi:hypothetical protein
MKRFVAVFLIVSALAVTVPAAAFSEACSGLSQASLHAPPGALDQAYLTAGRNCGA